MRLPWFRSFIYYIDANASVLTIVSKHNLIISTTLKTNSDTSYTFLLFLLVFTSSLFLPSLLSQKKTRSSEKKHWATFSLSVPVQKTGFAQTWPHFPPLPKICWASWNFERCPQISKIVKLVLLPHFKGSKQGALYSGVPSQGSGQLNFWWKPWKCRKLIKFKQKFALRRLMCDYMVISLSIALILFFPINCRSNRCYFK